MANTNEEIIEENRKKFTQNRVVYITPGHMKTSYDISPEALENLTSQLKEAKFDIRATTSRESDGKHYFTNDWFKHGEGHFFESYVITTVR